MALDERAVVRDRFAAHNTMSVVTITAIKMLILTGARRGEVAAMRWDELDFENGTWTLQWQRTKNRQAHTIHLSKLAIKLLNELKPRTGSSHFVFDTGLSTESKPIYQDTLTGVILRLRGSKGNLNYAALADMKPFSIHNIRRSAATAWGEYSKTDPHVIERMLNQQPMNKLIVTYQRAAYVEEQKAAWLAWGEMGEHAIATDNKNIENTTG